MEGALSTDSNSDSDSDLLLSAPVPPLQVHMLVIIYYLLVFTSFVTTLFSKAHPKMRTFRSSDMFKEAARWNTRGEMKGKGEDGREMVQRGIFCNATINH